MSSIAISNVDDEKQPVTVSANTLDDMDDKKHSVEPAEVHISDDYDSESQWTTTRLELWSYYLYYVGNNGLSG